ncbi:MAG: serine/threonine-protein kinase [Acidobacteriia bacterium]|nr:serine/threonine-protein kinase [Terriglobia bacterium]
MTPEKWEQISEVLEKALSLEGTQREQYLHEACIGDSELRREVESLLAAHQEAGSQFLNVAMATADGIAENIQRAGVCAGRRIGPYLVVDEIGHGGMGEVFAAVRADGQYEKKVALKLVRSGYDTAIILERFRNERQILAGLDHPNIARLLEGGTTDDGVPYLVMELVEGAPIDSYCDGHKLSVTERLQLFRQVCSAVQYAHQHLVIHRDIKPSNILVTQEGTPKLLDFGIAKILDASGSAEATSLRPMTPEYASPEQVRGEPITTASDVYSLGVVLYQLLTGHSPYRVETRTPHELSRAITETEPDRPSSVILRHAEVARNTPVVASQTSEGSPAKLKRRLTGDLDNIALKALRKEPGRRYSSVEQFAEDIRRHLAGLPVSAHKGSWTYRSGKFVQRHKAGVLAALLVLGTLITGVVVTLREARIAESNRRRAEARFNDVRKLANSLIFEIHDSIQDLPGATLARKLIVQNSLEYLDSLARESGNDTSLQRELATAYDKVGRVQGGVYRSNLGDTKSALESIQKSLRIRKAIVQANPRSVYDNLALAASYCSLGELQWGGSGDANAGYETCSKGVAISESLVKFEPDSKAILRELASEYFTIGRIQTGGGTLASLGNLTVGTEFHRKALEIEQKLAAMPAPLFEDERQVGVLNATLGYDMLKSGEASRALAYLNASRETFERLSESNDNLRLALRLNLLQTYPLLGDAYLVDDKPNEAFYCYQKGGQLAKQMAAIDPKDRRVATFVITTRGQIGHCLVTLNRAEEGLVELRQALATAQAESSPDIVSHKIVAMVEIWVAEALERSGRVDQAMPYYSHGRDIFADASAVGENFENQGYRAGIANDIAGALLKLGNPKAARDEYRRSLGWMELLRSTHPDSIEILYMIANSYAGLGDVSTVIAHAQREKNAQLRMLTEAHHYYQKSLATWQKVPHPGRFSLHGFAAIGPEIVTHRLSQCNAELAKH